MALIDKFSLGNVIINFNKISNQIIQKKFDVQVDPFFFKPENPLRKIKKNVQDQVVDHTSLNFFEEFFGNPENYREFSNIYEYIKYFLLNHKINNIKRRGFIIAMQAKKSNENFYCPNTFVIAKIYGEYLKCSFKNWKITMVSEVFEDVDYVLDLLLYLNKEKIPSLPYLFSDVFQGDLNGYGEMMSCIFFPIFGSSSNNIITLINMIKKDFLKDSLENFKKKNILYISLYNEVPYLRTWITFIFDCIFQLLPTLKNKLEYKEEILKNLMNVENLFLHCQIKVQLNFPFNEYYYYTIDPKVFLNALQCYLMLKNDENLIIQITKKMPLKIVEQFFKKLSDINSFEKFLNMKRLDVFRINYLPEYLKINFSNYGLDHKKVLVDLYNCFGFQILKLINDKVEIDEKLIKNITNFGDLIKITFFYLF